MSVSTGYTVQMEVKRERVGQAVKSISVKLAKLEPIKTCGPLNDSDCLIWNGARERAGNDRAARRSQISLGDPPRPHLERHDHLAMTSDKHPAGIVTSYRGTVLSGGLSSYMYVTAT